MILQAYPWSGFRKKRLRGLHPARRYGPHNQISDRMEGKTHKMLIGWKRTALGELSKTTSGGTPSRKRKDYYDGTIPWVKSGELNDGYIENTDEHISELGLKNSSAKLFSPGTLLIALYGATVGKTSILRTSAATNQAVCGITPGTTLDTEYLRYHLIFLRPKLLGHRYGGAQPNISQQIIRNLEVDYPPLHEQKKIAHLLSTVQRAIEAQERIIQTTTELKKALMRKLLTEGLRNEPKKQTEIGPIPESWEVVELGKHIRVLHGYAFKGEFFVSDGPTVLTPGNFKLDGGLYWGKRTKCTTERYDPSVVLHPGELVIVMTDLTPTAKLLGGPAFIPEGRTILHNQRIGKVSLTGSKTTLQFLYWVFMSDSFKRYMLQTATGSTVRHTSPLKIYKFACGLPSEEEQQQAIDLLTGLDAKIASAEQKLNAFQDLFRTFLDELMTAKTHVHYLHLK